MIPENNITKETYEEFANHAKETTLNFQAASVDSITHYRISGEKNDYDH